MKFSNEIVVDATDLEEAVTEAYEIESFELCTLFWEGGFMNDCYKNLYFADDEKTSWTYEGKTYECGEYEKERIELRNKVRQFLRAMFPHADKVLVDVSW